MNKATMFFNILLIGFVLACCNENPKSRVQKSSKAFIKTERETKFKAVNKFGVLEKGDIIEVIITHYDDKGNKSERNYYNPNGTMREKGIYKYDSNLNWEGVDAYGQGGRLIYHFIEGQQDEEGNTIVSYETNPNQDTTYSWESRHDLSGNVLEMTCYGQNRIFLGRYLYKYNDNNDRIEVLDYDADGKFLSGETNTYEKYDENGNWLIKISKGDNPSITEREIEYY